MIKFKGELKTKFDDFARTISDVLETDVIITDVNMNVIGSAFQYFSLYQDIKIGSLIAVMSYWNISGIRKAVDSVRNIINAKWNHL